jgi:hypothetical protein
MKASIRVTATALAVGALGGCAMWDSMGFGHRQDAAPSAEARATCEAAVESLRGKPDYDTALHACLDEKRRRPDKR